MINNSQSNSNMQQMGEASLMTKLLEAMTSSNPQMCKFSVTELTSKDITAIAESIIQAEVNGEDGAIQAFRQIVDASYEEEFKRLSLERRARRCVEDLRRRDLYFEDWRDAIVLLQKQERFKQFFYGVTVINEYPTNKVPITEDLWLTAVMKAVLLEKPDAFYDPDIIWRQFVSDLYPTIFLILWETCARQGKKKDTLDEGLDLVAQLGLDFIERSAQLEESESVVRQAQMEENFRQHISQKENELEKAKANIKFLRGEVSQLRKQLNSAQHKVTQPLKKELKELREGIDSRDTEIAKLQQESQMVKLALYEEHHSATGEVETSPACTLPANGIAFAGGHPNMVKKLKERFPNWDFISRTNGATEYRQANFVFIYSAHMSHTLWQRVRSQMPNTPIFYVSGTNLDLLVQDMQKCYSAYNCSFK